MSKKVEQWEIVGQFGVDSGNCWIGDPGYHSNDNFPTKDWDKFVETLDKEGYFEGGCPVPGVYQALPYKGVMVTTTGDGVYNVEARRTEKGNIAEIRIVFIPEDWEGMY